MTQATVGQALRRDANGAFKPNVVEDAEITGLKLIVTTRRAFWALVYQPHGLNPLTGKRWGGGTRHELGDAMTTTLPDARASALRAKACVRAGGDPHRERMRARAEAVALRGRKSTRVAGLLDDYAHALAGQATQTEASRRQSLHYARKAVRLMRAETLMIELIDLRMVRRLIEGMSGSADERRHVFYGLERFLGWLMREGVIETNPCSSLERSERPRRAQSREYVPSLDELRDVWRAGEHEPANVRDLIRFLLLTPLRRNEGARLQWGEVDFKRGWITIAGPRMKTRQVHELPLAPEALEILERRAKPNPKPDDLVFTGAGGMAIGGWTRILRRIRSKMGQDGLKRQNRFSLHDVRRAFVTHLADRFDENLLDLMLAHRPQSRAGASAAYQKAKRLPERAPVMAAWGRMIMGEIDAANVIPMHGARMV
jgi:integrase